MLDFQDVRLTYSSKDVPGDNIQAAKKEQCQWYNKAISKRVPLKIGRSTMKGRSLSCYPASGFT